MFLCVATQRGKVLAIGENGDHFGIARVFPGLQFVQGFYPEARRLLLNDVRERTQSSASAEGGLIPVSSTGWTVV
jgi:hypothetical protein